MAQQKAQAQLTIIDTNDISKVTNYYLASSSSSGITTSTSGWTTDPTSSAATMTLTKQYLWNYEKVIGVGPNNTETVISQTTPIIIGHYGQNGTDGATVTKVVPIYFLKLTSGSAPTAPAQGIEVISVATSSGVWTKSIPTYVNGATYYISMQTFFNKGTSPISSTAVIDNALTEASYNSAMANSLAQSANENANGAMGQASNGIKEIYRIWYRTNTTTLQQSEFPTTHVTRSDDVTQHWTKIKPSENADYRYYFYCEETITNGGLSSWTNPVLDTSNLSQYEIGALTAKVKNHWWDSEGAHIASGIKLSGDTEARSVTEGDYFTYGFNAITKLTGISFKYNNAEVIDLSTTPSPTSLKFYQPPTINGSTVTRGALSMELSSNALKFYGSSTSTPDATLNSNGLKLLKGGIEAGTPNQSNFIYLSTIDYPLRQFIHTSDVSIDINKEYYELSNNEFVLVEEPKVAAIANYYEISIDGVAINGHIPTEISAENRDIPWRQIIGNNFGVDADGNLYATGANISGRLTVTGGNVYTKDETDNNLNNTVNEAINNIDNNVIYAYSANSDGTNYSYDSSNLQYRGILVTNQKDGTNPIIPPEKHYEKTSDIEIHEDKIYYELVNNEGTQEYIQVDNPSVSDINNYYEFINEEPNKFQWEINPIYAEQHASNYIADFQGGIKISAANNTTNAYLSLTAALMQFWLNQRSMAQFGYNSIYESYGITVENVMITGAGNALRLDNGINGTYQGQFILETRSNGHLSLKPGLSRTEEEEI